MIPLYIIIPVTGIILLFKGFNADKGHGGKNIGFGFLLLSLPFLHAFLVQRIETNNEKSLIGNYSLDSTIQVVLSLKPNNTFELERIDSMNNFGTGKWQYQRNDIAEVDLTFIDNSQISFQVVFAGKGNYLQNSFWTGTRHKYLKLVKTDNKK